VIEVTHTSNPTIVWVYGDGSSTASNKNVTVAPNDALRLLTNQTLISCTGAPQGTEPTCTGASGCQDNRVILVGENSFGKYGKPGIAGSGHNKLNAPVHSTTIPGSNDILITDQGNQRILQGDRCRFTVAYGTTGVSGNGTNQLNSPNSAFRLTNGNLLIADEGNNRVFEVEDSGTIVWSYSDSISAPAFASRLPNGNTLITDSGNNRIIEVTQAGSIVWSYVTNNRTGSIQNPQPTRGIRLANGNTLISDQFNNQVIEVDTSGTIVWSFGVIGVSGDDSTHLNAPYDAKEIGDFTGLADPTSSNPHLIAHCHDK